MGIKEIMAGLVFDRTREDVDYAASLARSGVNTGENLRGAYNISDRNRVGSAVNYMLGEMFVIGLRAKDGWAVADIVKTPENINTLACLNRLREVLPTANAAMLPGSLDGLTYQKANGVENALYALCGEYLWIAENSMYCGDGYATNLIESREFDEAK